MPGFQLNRRADLLYFTVPDFTATGQVVHAFTTRLGGSSRDPFHSLNLGLHVGDDPQTVLMNRQRICNLLGSDISRLVAGQQVHGDRVLLVDESLVGRGAKSPEDALPGVDALVTATDGVLISSYYADCVPLMFFDPVHRVAALAHAGWKGTVHRIGAKTLRHMEEMHGCQANNIMVGVGPSIAQCCYEVGDHVMDKVSACLPGRSGLARQVKPGVWGLDLPEVNRRILLESGIKPDNITMSGYCTACSDDLFYSYRKQKGQTGRMASLIMLTGG